MKTACAKDGSTIRRLRTLSVLDVTRGPCVKIQRSRCPYTTSLQIRTAFYIHTNVSLQSVFVSSSAVGMRSIPWVFLLPVLSLLLFIAARVIISNQLLHE